MKLRLSLITLTILLVCFVFFSTLSAIQASQDELFFSSPLALAEKESNLHQIQMNFALINPSENPLSDSDLLTYLQSLSSEDELGVILMATDSDELGPKVQYFILGQTFRLDSTIAENLNWDDSSETAFISAESKEYPLFSLKRNPSYPRYYLRPWNQIPEHFSSFTGTYNVFLYSEGDLGKYLSDPTFHSFRDPLNPDIQTLNSSELGAINEPGKFLSKSNYILMIMSSLVILLLFTLYVCEKRNKEISIRKLQGQSIFHIFSKLVLPSILLIVLVMMVTAIILIILTKTGWNPLAFLLYKRLLVLGSVFMIGLLFASLFSIYYIKNAPFSYLKGASNNKLLVSLFYGIKLVALLLVISFCAALIDTSQNYLYMKDYSNTYPPDRFYLLSLTPQAENAGITPQQLQDAISNKALYLQTLEIIDAESAQKAQESEKEFDISDFISHKSIVASANVTDYVDILLADGSTFKPEPGKNYLLTTDDFEKETFYENYTIREILNNIPTSQIVELKINPNQKLLLPHEYAGRYDHYDGYSFLVLEKVHSFMDYYYLMDSTRYPITETFQDITEQGIPTDLTYALPRDLSQYLTILFPKEESERNFMIMGYFAIIMILISYSFNWFYLDNHRKTLAITYLLGKSTLHRYRSYLIGNLTPYVISLLFFVFFSGTAKKLIGLNYSSSKPEFNYNLGIIIVIHGVFFIVDALFSLLLIKKLDTSVLRSLKGGDLS